MEFANWYSVAKALHLIGMVSWMSGLFYLVRLMVYHAQSEQQQEPARSILAEQYRTMEWKVYNVILRPAVVITWVFGVLMLCLQPLWLEQPWLHTKLAFVLLLTAYTLYCRRHIRLLEASASPFTHVHYRALNEVPTIILAAAVFLAVFKERINGWYLATGLLAFSFLIGFAIRRVARKA